MAEQSLPKIKFMETSDLFAVREAGELHTPYETELQFYTCIQNGEVAHVKAMMEQLLSETVIAGRMSEHPLTRMKYWAVACITLATRYAIQGGLDQTTALNFSDENIFKLDKMTSEADILQHLQRMCIDLTTQVFQSRTKRDYPPAVRKCLHYIHANLHAELSADVLAQVCGLSPAYLALLFRQSVGQTIRGYVRDQRLNYAKGMLRENKSTSEIAYDLGFCSESYFIKCFREKFGVTPGTMKKRLL